MKGFFLFINLFFSSFLFANVFLSPKLELSPSVLSEINVLKKNNSLNKKILSNSKKINNSILNKKVCIKFNKKINGGFFSPTKSFDSKFIHNSETFYSELNPGNSNIQFGIENNNKTFIFYSGLYKNADKCFYYEMPPVNDVKIPSLAVKIDKAINKVDLDKAFKTKEKVGDWIFFYGVEHGNLLLKLFTSKGHAAEGIIHLHSGATQVISAELEVSHRSKIRAREINLMAIKESKLDLKEFKIKEYFSSKSLYFKDERITLKEKINLKGFKYMVQLKGNDEVFLNTKKNVGAFTLMNQKYRNYFLNMNNIESATDICLINFPVRERVLETSFINSNGEQEVDLDTYFLNKTGEISSKAKKETYQILLAGYHNGAIDYKIKYSDKTLYGQTYCAIGTFLIEN